MVVALTQCPECGYLGDSLTYELGSCPRCGRGLFLRLMDPEVFYALHVKPGMVIWHPVPEATLDGSVLILAVDGPDEEGMMTFGTPLGPVSVVADWPCREFTEDDGYLAGFLLQIALLQLRLENGEDV